MEREREKRRGRRISFKKRNKEQYGKVSYLFEIWYITYVGELIWKFSMAWKTLCRAYKWKIYTKQYGSIMNYFEICIPCNLASWGISKLLKLVMLSDIGLRIQVFWNDIVCKLKSVVHDNSVSPKPFLPSQTAPWNAWSVQKYPVPLNWAVC